MKKLVLLLLIGLFTVTPAVLAQNCQFEEVFSFLESAKTEFDAGNSDAGLELIAQAQAALEPCAESADCPVNRLNVLLNQISSAPSASRSQILTGAMTLLSTCGVETSAGSSSAISLENVDQLQVVNVEFYPDELRSMIVADVYLDTDEWLLAGIDFGTDMYILRHTPGLGWATLHKVPLNMGTEFASGIRLSNDGNTVFGGISYYLFVVDAEEGAIVSKDLLGSYATVADVAKNNASSLIAVAVQPNVIFYETDTLSQRDFINVGVTPMSIEIHPDGQQMAVSTAGSVSIWDLTNYERLATLDVSSEWVMRAIFLEKTNRLLTFDANGVLNVWDLDTNTRIGEIQVEDGYSKGAVVSLSEDMLFIPTRGGIAIIDLTQNQLIDDFDDFDLPEDMEGPGIIDLRLLPGGEELLALGYSATYVLSVVE